jgi:phage/plasmid-like protein (TIGR03299 family)
MAHEVENMFSVRETPWHGLGVILNDPPTVYEGIKQAGLDWNVVLKDLYTQDLHKVGYKAVVRETDNQCYGVVGGRFEPLQNSQAFQWFEPFMDKYSLETGGALKEGKNIWVLAKRKDAPMAVSSDDLVNKYLMLSNSHDGKTTVRAGETPIRVVCSNTLRMAHSDKGSSLIRIRHTKSVNDNLSLVGDLIRASDESYVATMEVYRRLARTQVNRSDLKRYVQAVFNMQDTKDKPVDGSPIYHNVVRLFETGRGANLSTRGTMWTAYNAVNEYLGYEKGDSQESRLNSLWFGPNAVLNKRALDIAEAMAA